jgi:predicted O-methyltransferase YrrM
MVKSLRLGVFYRPAAVPDRESGPLTTRSIFLPDAIHAWLQTNTLRESALLGRLRAETATLAEASYQIAPEQGQMLTFLIELTAARNTLDIGTFTGYSALVAAAAMPAEGRVVACDVSAGWTGIARRYWAEAGVEDRIDLRLGPALATLDGLCAEGRAGTFDFALIDADKEPYPDYY